MPFPNHVRIIPGEFLQQFRQEFYVQRNPGSGSGQNRLNVLQTHAERETTREQRSAGGGTHGLGVEVVQDDALARRPTLEGGEGDGRGGAVQRGVGAADVVQHHEKDVGFRVNEVRSKEEDNEQCEHFR